MITYASAQRLGTRLHQCDATATATERGVRAWALLDGIGDRHDVRTWARRNARLLAQVAAHTDNPLAAVAAVHTATGFDEYANEPEPPDAVAVVAVRAENGPLRLAWRGDARAYWWPWGESPLRKITTDHNMAQRFRERGITNFPVHYRNQVTSSLRHPNSDTGTETVHGRGRLVLCSDGVYSPFEDNGAWMGAPLATFEARTAARDLVVRAVGLSADRTDNATAYVVDFRR
ncbi:PP2C family protein-serine/threonine phosphatase [Streptomyces microflavus]|uniref:PP2C family protein-serine/threonine phosphatase n=1 Tax=Streptomyces microflavus TaxID=1919 RepID=UPI00381AFC87